MKKTLILLLGILLTGSAVAQVDWDAFERQRQQMRQQMRQQYERERNKAQQQYGNARKKAEEEYAAFRKKANEDYAAAVLQAWAQMGVQPAEPKPEEPKPPTATTRCSKPSAPCCSPKQ